MLVGAALDAKGRGLLLDIPLVDPGLAVHADRPLLASAVANLRNLPGKGCVFSVALPAVD